MSILKIIIKKIKSVIKWASWHNNRVELLTYTNASLRVLKWAASLTENKQDDAAVAMLKDKIGVAVSMMPGYLADETFKVINDSKKGSLKTVHIGYNKDKGLNAGLDIKF